MALVAFSTTAVSHHAMSQASSHSCGAPNVHNPSVSYGRATDIDGNSYKTVVIGGLVWFAENLRVTRFQNGDPIPEVSDSAAWRRLTGPGRCSYRNDPNFDCPRGKLYNHHVVTDPRNPCPAGWRVPSMADLYGLIFHLDPNANPQQPGNQPNKAGGALKSSGLTYWRSPNANATNLSGFSAIPNGARNNTGLFSLSSDAAASYWLSTQVGPGMGFFLELAFPQDWAVRNAYFSGYGICIRCVKEQGTPDIGDKNPLSIFPNPNSGRFIVRLSSGFSDAPQAVTLCDAIGSQVYAQTMTFSNREARFDLSHLAAGVYVIAVRDTRTQEIRTEKVAIKR
jgi:uncharacterized protein (TIGR02145 family)